MSNSPDPYYMVIQRISKYIIIGTTTCFTVIVNLAKKPVFKMNLYKMYAYINVLGLICNKKHIENKCFEEFRP